MRGWIALAGWLSVNALALSWACRPYAYAAAPGLPSTTRWRWFWQGPLRQWTAIGEQGERVPVYAATDWVVLVPLQAAILLLGGGVVAGCIYYHRRRPEAGRYGWQAMAAVLFCQSIAATWLLRPYWVERVSKRLPRDAELMWFWAWRPPGTTMGRGDLRWEITATSADGVHAAEVAAIVLVAAVAALWWRARRRGAPTATESTSPS